MGDDTPVDVVGQGRIEIPHGIFEIIFHVPILSVNILFIYQITHMVQEKGWNSHIIS